MSRPGLALAVAAIVAMGAIGCQGGESPPLSEVDQEVVTINGGTAFGTITVGQTSAPISIVVAPGGGNNTDRIDAITEDCPDFDLQAAGLPAYVIRTVDCCPTCLVAQCVTDQYDTYTFGATFHPSVGGTQSCVVSIQLDSGVIRTVTLTGTGQVPPVDIDVQPTGIAFGDVRVNSTSAPATVAVRNLGDATMTVSSAQVSAGFTLRSAAAFDVGPGGSTGLDVTCDPTSAGDLSGSLSIASNDATTPNLDVPLTCAGVMSNLAIDPSPAILPLTRVGSPTGTTINLTNLGTASTTIQSVTVDGEGLTLGNDPTGDIGPGATIGIDIGFDGVAHGDTSGTLTVVTPEGTRTAQLTARAVVPTIALAPDGAVDFGPVCVGQTATRPFTILDLGDGDFDIVEITTPAPPFTSLFDGPETVQASGANMSKFEISATPTEAAVATSEVTVTTDIANDPGHVISVSVTGLAAGATATPATLDLGSNPLDTTTVAQTITLTNCDPAAIEFTNARIEGDDVEAFTIVASPTTTSIAASGAAQWLVVFDAHTMGTKSATFSVDHPGGTAVVALLGEGLDPSIGNHDTHSYYTCNAGGLAGWPLGLALLAMRRRRRA